MQGKEAMGEVPGRRHAIGEVPGRSGASREVTDVESGSDDSTPYCQPCVNVLATAFCNDCRHYLCSPCTDYHRKLALTKNHKLLAGSAMPSFYAGRPVGTSTRGEFKTAQESRREYQYCVYYYVQCVALCGFMVESIFVLYVFNNKHILRV